ncbi:hypothetical protein B0O80DRAFT_92110 [Mortierella sp. GBAus27b]|nr:hypothetical protein B0O80DRAFT_92110 [Mortierella sp. GBAus27b]
MPPSKHPLEITEIVHQIVSYIPTKDLATCILVSKRWREMLLPVLWRKIELQIGSWLSNSPHPSDIFRRRHLIQDLTITGDPFGVENFQYPNLLDLTICDVQQDRRVFLDVRRMFPALFHLTLVDANISDATWSTLSAHPRLRYLHLSRTGVNDSAGFWNACMNLETLELNIVTIANGRIPRDIEFRRMRTLDLNDVQGVDTATQFDLFLRSPKLEFMRWTVDNLQDHPSPNLITRPIQRGHWPHLDTLLVDFGLQDTDMASVLEGAGDRRRGIASFKVSGPALGVRAFKSLGFHFSTLVHLNLKKSYATTSSMFLDILCRCPMLEVFIARSILARDVAKGEPWQCRNLQRLAVCFRFEETERSLQSSVFQRLSTLTFLESLMLYHPSNDRAYEGCEVLRFRLEHGLRQLERLERLRSLEFGCSRRAVYYPQLGVREVEWLTKSLNLGLVSGNLHRDRREDARLKDELRQRGVSVI